MSAATKETSIEDKVTALRSLVEKKVLSQPECDTCIRALKRESSEKGVFYRDKFIAVNYRGHENCEMMGGKGFKVYLVIENRTSDPLSLRARILLNGVILEKNECIMAEIPARSKILVSHAFFYDSLKPLDIKALKHVQEIGYMFRYCDLKSKTIGEAKKNAVLSFNG